MTDYILVLLCANNKNCSGFTAYPRLVLSSIC